jgi:hypothetical protein
MDDAMKLEKLAIRDEGRALQICLDYPVEYNYGWEDDKTLEEIVALMRDPALKEPPEDIFATIDKEARIDSMLLKEIIFKVQVAAHTMPLSNEYLKSLYDGDLRIDMIFEDEWYKYSIGRYLSFDEADATCRECNISVCCRMKLVSIFLSRMRPGYWKRSKPFSIVIPFFSPNYRIG